MIFYRNIKLFGFIRKIPMPNLYPHAEHSLPKAKIPPNDLDEHLELLYFDLYGVGQKPDYAFRSLAYNNEIDHLFTKIKALVNTQEARDDEHKINWEALQVGAAPSSGAQLNHLIDSLKVKLTVSPGYRPQFEPQAQYFKTMLEKSYLLLAQRCQSHPKEGQQLLGELIYEFGAFAPGVIGHTGTIYSRLNSHNDISYWLAQLRTGLVDSGVSQGLDAYCPDIHFAVGVFNDCISIGLNPLREVVVDGFVGKPDQVRINQFYKYFAREYNAKGITDCVTSNTAGLLKEISDRFDCDEDGWIDIDPESDNAVEYPDVQSKASNIIDALMLDPKHTLKIGDILELDDDATKVRINPELLGDKLSKFIANYLEKVGVLTKTKADAIQAEKLIEQSVAKRALPLPPAAPAHVPPAAPAVHLPPAPAAVHLPPPVAAPAALAFAHDLAQVKSKAFAFRIFLVSYALASDVFFYAFKHFLPTLVAKEPVYNLMARLMPYPTLTVPLLATLYVGNKIRKYGANFYNKKPVLAGSTMVSQAEKDAFQLGVEAQISYKSFILNSFKPAVLRHPVAALAGAEAAYQLNRTLINHMKP